MLEPITMSEVDRTKSRWIANTFREFGRPKTTLRSLFYFALSRSTPDYPICGGFVGEIRILRHYHESDGEKLAKWVEKAKMMGYIPKDAILPDLPGEHIFFPASYKGHDRHLELWLNKPALVHLLRPLCEDLGITLVSVNRKPSESAILDLLQRSIGNRTIIFCLSDLSASDFLFCEDLSQSISTSISGPNRPDIQLKKIGLSPEQVIDLKIPMVPGKAAEKSIRDKFKRCLKPFHLDPKRMAELDALEAYHPGGISGFVAEALASQIDESEILSNI